MQQVLVIGTFHCLHVQLVDVAADDAIDGDVYVLAVIAYFGIRDLRSGLIDFRTSILFAVDVGPGLQVVGFRIGRDFLSTGWVKFRSKPSFAACMSYISNGTLPVQTTRSRA